MIKKKLIVLTALCSSMFSSIDAQKVHTQFDTVIPETTSQTKPWTRWWWMGSAVDSSNLRLNLINLNKMGIGGVEIAPIYGVKGEEANFIDYLSPQWMDMLGYATKVADSLQMQVDLTLGTGWPYGGAHVTPEFAATKLIVQKYLVTQGESLDEQIVVNNEKESRYATLKYLLAFGKNGDYKNLTPQLKDNFISWKAKRDNYTVFAVFSGKTGQRVKRAAPGGKGFTLDHYSRDALQCYVKPFNKAFQGFDGKIRSIFNDSYEVYGTDFTPNFFEAFKKYRGYDLKPHIPLLVDKADNEQSNRIKSDYRETLSDLLLFDFDEPWTQWAHGKKFKSRLQAHGSPGNLIDLYAAADIPECETFGSMPYDIPGLRREKQNIREGDADPVMLKFSSSAAHIAGKPLISSETFTWLRDHFKVALSQCKPEVEDLFLNGVNHIFLHGTTYSPARAAWPGWKFYASVNFNPNLTIGEDASNLFSYINNCQALLQAGKPDNETLLYWPVHDVWGSHLKGALFFQFKIHSLEEWLLDQPFYETTKSLMENGYGLDFISDRFIEKAKYENGLISLPGGTYKSLVVPRCEFMPLSTLKKLIALKKEGAQIIFQGLPTSTPGYHNYKENSSELNRLLETNNTTIQPSKDIFADLKEARVFEERLVESGLKFTRRALKGEKIYYLVNHTAKTINQFIPINGRYKNVVIIDPKINKYGKAAIKTDGNKTLVKIKIKPGDALFLKTLKETSVGNWEYFKNTDASYPINGTWTLSFLKGGPVLPGDFTLPELKSWTALDEQAEAFSGTAQYEIEFENPDDSVKNWQLNLGKVRESAKVWVNDEYMGTVWANPYEIDIKRLKKGTNKLMLEITNLSANRIRAKELRGEEWKNFYEINMVDKDYNEFDATKWDPVPSGLLGPVSIKPLIKEKL